MDIFNSGRRTGSIAASVLASLLMAPIACAQTGPGPHVDHDAYLTLMKRAAADAKANGDRFTPALSPSQNTVLGANASIDVKALQAAGFLVVPWTIDDAPAMKALLALHVDGIISDRPDMLAQVLQEARTDAAGDNAQLAYLDRLDAEGHRGGRGIRPENTLPAFEAGMDNGIHSIETDTGVTTDRQSLIWHDQFLNPQSCRRADGQPYTLENRLYIHEISMADAQKQFICDKLHFGPEQKNDLALSPVSVAFAAQEHMVSPYSPTNVAQLFRFVAFYTRWYESGGGRADANAAARARTGRNVHFNLETKIQPPGFTEARIAAMVSGTSEDALKASGKLPVSAFSPSNTVSPEIFVDTLCGFVHAYHMEDRADIQSFDFRTLLLVQKKFPLIQTFYLTESTSLLSSDYVPAMLRVPASSDRNRKP